MVLIFVSYLRLSAADSERWSWTFILHLVSLSLYLLMLQSINPIYVLRFLLFSIPTITQKSQNESYRLTLTRHIGSQLQKVPFKVFFASFFEKRNLFWRYFGHFYKYLNYFWHFVVHYFVCIFWHFIVHFFLEKNIFLVLFLDTILDTFKSKLLILALSCVLFMHSFW